MRTQPAGLAQRKPHRLGRSGSAGFSRRGELTAALATALLVAELVLAPVTLALTAALVAAGRLAKWRPHWLAVPAAAGLAWTAVGPAGAAVGFAAWPLRLVGYLEHMSGHLGEAASRPAGAASVLASLGHELPRQLPIALAAGAAQAAVAAYLGCKRRDMAWRPGLIAAIRLRRSRAALGAGQTVTRDGCGIGLDLDTGRLADLSWMEAARGVLLTGKHKTTAGDLGLAVASAAIRLRKTVLIVDLDNVANLVSELASSSGVPLTAVSIPAGGIPGTGTADELASRMGLAVRGRSVVLVSADPGSKPEQLSARQAVASLLTMLTSLRAGGLRADCLAWITGCEAVETELLTALIELGPLTGTAVVLSGDAGTRSAGLRQAVEVVVDVPSPAAFSLTARTQRPRTLLNCRAVGIAAFSRSPAQLRTAGNVPRASASGVPGVVPRASASGVPGVVPRASASGVPGVVPRASASGVPGVVPRESTAARTAHPAAQPPVTGSNAVRWPDTMVAVPRGKIRADLIYLGWRQAGPQPEPGRKPDPPPAEVPLDEVNADWLAAQRREHTRLARPARLGLAASLAAATTAAACLPAGLASTALASTALSSTALASVLAVLIAAALSAAAACGRTITRDNRARAAALCAEEDRVAAFGVVQRSQAAALQRQHALEYRSWQRRSSAYWRRPQWHAVTLPTGVCRVDVAGGTLAGWSALLTMLAAARLGAGGDVMVIDLTEGAVAKDLIGLASRWCLDPLVWVLPADLPRLDLGTGLRREVLADMLALTVSAAESYGRAAGGPNGASGDPARDAALLSRVLEVLGDDATMAQLTAALRALAQVGGARKLLDGGDLWHDQLTKLAGLFGRGGERLVIDRSLAMEARLRTLAPLASARAVSHRSKLKVACLDRRAAAAGNALLGSYLAVALTTALRQAPPGRPWQQTVCLLGAERLPGEVLDRLCDAAETVGTGLLLGYRSIPAHVRERLGRGNAAVAYMRLGNADDARLAAEQIGTEHRFVVSQLTDTVGASVTDTLGDSYTSTVGTADSLSDSRSLSVSAGRSQGRGRQASSAPFADFTGSVSRDANSSTSVSDSRSVSEGINASTSWGTSTSRALGTSDSKAVSAQRSREFLVEASELQQLPHSAVLVSYAGPGGRRVLLADANPAIMTLPTATFSVTSASLD